jgi:hypothetical protein
LGRSKVSLGKAVETTIGDAIKEWHGTYHRHDDLVVSTALYMTECRTETISRRGGMLDVSVWVFGTKREELTVVWQQWRRKGKAHYVKYEPMSNVKP